MVLAYVPWDWAVLLLQSLNMEEGGHPCAGSVEMDGPCKVVGVVEILQW